MNNTPHNVDFFLLTDLKNRISQLIWRPVFDHCSLKKIHHISDKPFKNCVPDFSDKEVNESYTKDNLFWFHNEFIYRIDERVLIEPSNCICIKGLRTIIKETLPNKSALPSIIKYLASKLFLRKNVFLNEAILFDNDYGLNYFHFFSDVINKLWLAENFNISKEIPLIIPEKLNNKPYFQIFLRTPELSCRRWIIQKKQTGFVLIHCIFLKAMPYFKDYWFKTLSLINNHQTTPFKKIFFEPTSKRRAFFKKND